VASWFSCAQLEKFRINPNSAQSFRLKLDISVLVEAPNGIDLSHHAPEQLFGTQLVFYAWCIGYLAHPDNFDFVTDLEFSFAHDFLLYK
jgi:hypothetical protein